MFERNDLDHDDLISILFTATDDLNSTFPATAARTFGLGDVPLICARELDIVGGTPAVIRVMMHLEHRPDREPSCTTCTSRAPATCATTCPADGRRLRPPNRPGRAGLVGTGLIGGSIGLALRAQGWHVTGSDRDAAVAARALALGALDAIGTDPDADITFVATPRGRRAGRRPCRARSWAAASSPTWRGVKAAVVDAIDDARFVGGHPMAGSEQLGVDGASADLFEGAVWVLTPVAGTDPDAYALVRPVVSSLGAEVARPGARPPRRPGRRGVPRARTSRRPRSCAWPTSERPTQAPLLRLAAGGFRDMTRVAAGSPAIWPDVCAENRVAIVEVLDQLLGALGEVRDAVAKADRADVLATLEQAQRARRSLPSRAVRPDDLAEVRVPVPDRPGVLAEVTTLATDIGANIFDLEIAHSTEGDRGVLIAVVDASTADELRAALADRGYRPSVSSLGR